MVYDSGRERTVVVGGNLALYNFYNLGTFEWLGDQWGHRVDDGSETTPSVHKPMCYLESLDALVMHVAGEGTWHWTQSGWALQEALAQPPDRYDFSLVCDHTNQRVLLFGGRAAGYVSLNDLWAWDGQDWTLVHASDPDDAGLPAPRQEASLVHDPDSGTVVLFGGTQRLSGSVYVDLDDTWVLNGADWTEMDLSGPVGDPEGDGNPAARVLAGMEPDPGGIGVHLINGTVHDSHTDNLRYDHWNFDGTSWERVEDVEEAPRQYGQGGGATWASAMDPTMAEILMLGSENTALATLPLEVWRWNGISWSTTDIVDAHGDGVPNPRNDHKTAWFGPTGDVVMFGGLLYNSLASRQTWLWENGVGERPGQVLRCNLAASGLDDPALFSGLEVVWQAGGSGTANEVETDGARLLIWESGTFVQKDSNQATPEAKAELTWSTQDASVLQRLTVTDDLLLGAAVTPVGSNWKEYAEVSTSYLEVVLSYRIE